MCRGAPGPFLHQGGDVEVSHEPACHPLEMIAHKCPQALHAPMAQLQIQLQVPGRTVWTTLVIDLQKYITPT